MGVATDILFRGNALGVNVPIDLALLLVAGALAAGPARIRRVDRLDAWLAPAALAFAAFVALRADPALVAVDVVGAVILGGAALASLGGRALMRADAGRIAATAGEMALATVIGAVPVAGALRPRQGERTGRAAPGWAAPLLRGMLVATPLLLVFVVLFAEADAVFAAAAGRVLALPFDLPVAELAERSAGVAIVAWIAAGVLVAAAGFWVVVSPPAAPVSFDPPVGTPPAGDGVEPEVADAGEVDLVDRPGRFRIGHPEALVVLVMVDLLFAAFVALQVAYLFGGLDTLAAAGLTYADYARRGFFELLAAAALAAAVVATLDARVRRRSRGFVVAALALLGLTGITLVSSFLRLRLYQDAYGWTELRFWVLSRSAGWPSPSSPWASWWCSGDRAGWSTSSARSAWPGCWSPTWSGPRASSRRGTWSGRWTRRSCRRAAGPAWTGRTSPPGRRRDSGDGGRPARAGRAGPAGGARAPRGARPRAGHRPEPRRLAGLEPGPRAGPGSPRHAGSCSLTCRRGAGRPRGRAKETRDGERPDRYDRPATPARDDREATPAAIIAASRTRGPTHG